jgi:hypothetical protein
MAFRTTIIARFIPLSPEVIYPHFPLAQIIIGGTGTEEPSV